MNRGRSRGWSLPILALLTVALLLLHESGVIRPIEDLAQTALAPVQRVLSGIFDGLTNTFGALRDLQELRQTNQDLQRLNEELLLENVRLREFEAENRSLRDMLQFTQENPTYVTQPAAVIGRDPSPYQQYITINAGSREGIDVGMSVLTTGSALVGRVSEVGLGSSKVQLLIDSNSAVNVRIQSSRATGLAEGQFDGSLLLSFIPLDDPLNVGDLVLTSGLGGNLPRGLVVGQVTDVIKRDIDTHQSANLRPAADFNKLELLLVITDFEPLPVEPEIEATPTLTPTAEP